MALPAEINSAETPFCLGVEDSGGDCGPWTYEGAVFVLCRDQTNGHVEMWLDEGANRGEGFAEADSANHPSGKTTADYCAVRAAPDSDLIYVVYPDPSNNLELAVFSMATRTWARTITTNQPVWAVPTAEAQGNGVAIVTLPGDSVRVVFNGAQVSSKDVVYFDDVDLTAGQFSGSPAAIHTTGTRGYEIRSALRGIGGITHCFLLNDLGAIIHRSIDPDGTLNTEQTVVAFGGGQFGWDLGDAYFSVADGAVKLAIPYGVFVTSPNVYEELWLATADSEVDPTWSTEAVSDTDPIGDPITGSLAAFAWFSGQRHYVHRGIAASLLPYLFGTDHTDIYRRADTGSGFGSSLTLRNGGSNDCRAPRVRAIDIGLGFVWTENAKPMYDQLEIDPCEGSAPTVNLVGAAY